MILKLSMLRKGLKLYKVYINDNPGLTLTYFTARSNWVAYTIEWGNTVTKSLNGGKLAAKDYIDQIIMLMKKLTPVGCLPLTRGYIHVYDHFFSKHLLL